jgi:flagellar protein FlbD
MIRLTRLNHVPLVLNADLIEHIEVTPDTVITLITGQKMMVLESANEVVRRVIDFRRCISNPGLDPASPFAPGELESPGAEDGGAPRAG